MGNVILQRFDARRDLDFVRLSMTENEDRFLFSFNLNINSFQSFERWFIEQLNGNFHDFYMVYTENDYEPVGYVYSYGFLPTDGHCRICVYIDAAYRLTGIGGIAAARFIKDLFTAYPLRKVYSTVFGYNTQSLESNLHAGFIEEAVLPSFKFYNGQYFDYHILSIDRESFFRIFEELPL